METCGTDGCGGSGGTGQAAPDADSRDEARGMKGSTVVHDKAAGRGVQAAHDGGMWRAGLRENPPAPPPAIFAHQVTPAQLPDAPPASRRLPWLNAWLCLALYFGAQTVCRVLVSPALELDEAEQVLWSQQLALGYGTQPPLYTWLQWAVFQLCGASVVSLALLKNLLLASTYGFVFLAGRLLMPTPLAALAAASMLLLPQIGWESSRDLTHSVLLTTLAAATLYLTLALLQRPRPALYLLLGATAGLGFLAKYSYGLFLLALMLALLAGRDTRAVMRSPWTLAAMLIALLILMPHGLWLLDHWHQVTESTMAKLEGGPTSGRTASIARGLLSLLAAMAGFLWPWALAMGLLFGRTLFARRSPHAATATRTWDPSALWRRYAMVLAVLFVAMVLVAGVTHFKDRWMQPFLFCVPLMVFSARPQLAGHLRLGRLRRILLGVGLLVLVLLALRPHYHAWRGKPDELNLPAHTLVQALREAGYAGRGTIVTSDRALGGTLRLQFPAARVELSGAAAPGQWSVTPLLVIDHLTQEAPQATALQALERQLGPQQPVALALPYRHAKAAAPPARLVYVLRN